jgi:hypothetical protein
MLYPAKKYRENQVTFFSQVIIDRNVVFSWEVK